MRTITSTGANVARRTKRQRENHYGLTTVRSKCNDARFHISIKIFSISFSTYRALKIAQAKVKQAQTQQQQDVSLHSFRLKNTQIYLLIM